MARADKPIESDSDILDPVTVKASEADDDIADDEPDDAEPAAAEPQRQQQTPTTPTRTDGRTNGAPTGRQGRGPKPSSWKGMIEKMVTERTGAHEKTIGELRQQIAQMEGRYQAIAQMRQQGVDQQQPAGPSQELAAIGKEMQDIAKLAANPNLTDEQRQDLGNRYQSLDEKRLDLRATAVAERIVAEKLKDIPQGPSQEESIGLTILSTEYPRLMADPAAKAEAKHYYGYLVARNGGVETPDIFREACQHVYTQKGWATSQPRPSERERRMWESSPGTGRGGGSNDGAITFQQEDLKVMRGAPVTPEQVAEQMRVMQKRGW